MEYYEISISSECKKGGGVTPLAWPKKVIIYNSKTTLNANNF